MSKTTLIGLAAVGVTALPWLYKQTRRHQALPCPDTAKTVVLIDNLDEGLPGREHFRIESSPVKRELKEGDVLVQALVMSADPYLRGYIKTTGSIKAGQPMSGFIAGKVLDSKNPKWVPGDLFGAAANFSTVQVISAAMLKATPMWKLTGIVDEENISLGVGILGMPGSTAYGGLVDVLRPKKGQTIWVSGAAGAVGGFVGQMAKNVFGCHVIGSAGGPAKCDMVVNKFGFDACVDYKQATDTESLAAMIKEKAPEGVDMYFENVGGMHFEAAMANLGMGGRIAVCGYISKYNDGKRSFDNIDASQMIYTGQRIEGFVCMPWLTGQKGAFLKDVSSWWKQGKIAVEETYFDGIDSWPDAFHSLFVGGNKGKVVVRL